MEILDVIKTEIERLKKHYRIREEYGYGWKNALNAISKFLDTLPEQPVNDGLEEAAEAYSEQVSDGHNYRDLTCGFIAGAQWRDAQGVNYELEVKADAGGYPYIDKTFELYDYTEEKNIFNPGDKVIVNIRKKEDKK